MKNKAHNCTQMIKLFLPVIIILFTKIIFAQELMRYTCQVDRVDIVEFESSRSFDKNGIILSAKKYHPLSIATYGILTYYKYLETLDSTYYSKCINQMNYFKDTTKVNLMFNGKGIGLPYNFKFWDLKAPWYSGMTQGFALSYLLRYYKLTQDKSILPIIEKIAFVLLAPQETGGTISKTKEGCTWIEEYPNSKKSPQVLNGFINGLIGLYEYCSFFEDDLHAKQIFTESYECLKASLEYYDTPTWSSYNRNKKSISNKYLRYQIFEMKHLYEIFQDPIFDSQMRIWAVMSFNKFIKGKTIGDKFKNYNFSKPVKKMNDSLYYIPLTAKQLINTDSVKIYNFRSIKEYRKYLKGKIKNNVKQNSKIRIINFHMAKTTEANYIEITFNDTSVFNYDFSAYKKSKEDSPKLLEIEVEKFYDGNRLLISFQKMYVSDLYIKLEKKNKFNLASTKVKLYNTTLDSPSLFAHYKYELVQMEKGITYKIDLPLLNTDNAVLFYKFATSSKTIKNYKWKAINTLELDENFSPTKSGQYLFMIVYNLNTPLSFIGNLNFSVVPDLQEK